MRYDEKAQKIALEIKESHPNTAWNRAVKQAEGVVENMRKYDEATQYYRNGK